MSHEEQNMERTLSAGGGVGLIGGKAARLSQLTRYFNVPPGFVITTQSFDLWRETGKLTTAGIEDLFLSPYVLEGEGPVIVRSSATLEDGRTASFPGVFESYAHLNTVEEIVDAVRKCFESILNERASAYCRAMDIDLRSVRMACLVQRMINTKWAGVLFTRSPTEVNSLVVEYAAGSWSDAVGDGRSPTRVRLKREPPDQMVEKLPKRCAFLDGLIRMSLEIEDLFAHPQDIEWGFDGGRFFIFQSRDITTAALKTAKGLKRDAGTSGGRTLTGTPASPGKAYGKSQFVLDDQPPEEAARLFEKGNVLVSYVLHAEYYPVFSVAKAIVTKVDSILCHPAIYARELGIPCVVGVEVEHIRDGDHVSVDGDTGQVTLSHPRTVLQPFELTVLRPRAKSKEARDLRTDYIDAVRGLEVDEVKKVLGNCFARIRQLFLAGRKKEGFELYYLINTLMEKTTSEILSDIVEDFPRILQRVDRGEELKGETEKRIGQIYSLIKEYINYQTEDTRDIPHLLFGLAPADSSEE